MSGLGHMTRNRECSFMKALSGYRGFAIAKGGVCMHAVSAFKEYLTGAMEFRQYKKTGLHNAINRA